LIEDILSAGVRIAAPIAFACLGELINQRSGIMNLGIEGIMLISAFSGFAGAFLTGSLLVGVLFGLIAGALMGLLVGVLSIKLKANQVIAGIAIWIFGVGLSIYAYRAIFGGMSIPPTIEGFKATPIPILGDIPVIGEILFRQNVLVYLSYLLVFALWFILIRTKLGLKITAVGEDPKVADISGINVFKMRYFAVIAGSALIGLGGAYLPLAYIHTFAENVVSGRGWIAFSLVIFGRWHPLKTFAAALMFGIIDASQLYIQGSGFAVPLELMLMLPYLFTILVLVIGGTKSGMPASLGKPYSRE